MAKDASSTSTVAWIIITNLPVNDAPFSYNQTVVVPEDSSTNITLGGFDVEGDPLRYTIQTSPAHGTLSGSTSNVVLSPGHVLLSDSDQFTYVVDDGQLTSAVATVSITITHVNHTPAATGQALTNLEDTTLPITLSGTDEDNDSLAYQVSVLPTNGTLSGTAPNVSYRPATNYFGLDALAFVAKDASSTSAVAWIVITNLPVNDAPISR